MCLGGGNKLTHFLSRNWNACYNETTIMLTQILFHKNGIAPHRPLQLMRSYTMRKHCLYRNKGTFSIKVYFKKIKTHAPSKTVDNKKIMHIYAQTKSLGYHRNYLKIISHNTLWPLHTIHSYTTRKTRLAEQSFSYSRIYLKITKSQSTLWPLRMLHPYRIRKSCLSQDVIYHIMRISLK